MALQNLCTCDLLVVVGIDDFARDVLYVLRAVFELCPLAVSPEQSASTAALHRRLQPKHVMIYSIGVGTGGPHFW